MKRRIVFSMGMVLILGVLIRCGSDAANALSSATTGLTNAPDVNPSNLDSATGSSSIALPTKFAVFEEARVASSLDIDVVATPVTNGVDFTMKQCANDSQSHFVNIVATNESGKIKYVKTETLKSAFNGNMNITSTVYTDANGVPNGARASTIRSNSPYDFYSSFSSDGTTNKFSATNGTNHVAGAWTNTLGCAKIGSAGTEVAFALSVSSTGQRTCTASSDTSVCASLPTMETSVPAFADFSGTQIFSCAQTTGCTLVTPSSAIGLEDAGGTFCASLSGTKAFWASASTTVDCSTTTTATGVCNCLWPFYAAASTKMKSSMRSGECKVKGMVNNGDFNTGTDLATTKNVCVQNLSIGGR